MFNELQWYVGISLNKDKDSNTIYTARVCVSYAVESCLAVENKG